MRKTLTILTLLVQLFLSSLLAQSNYPIYVAPTLTPPYSLNLSDYSAMGAQKLMVTIVVNDLDVTNLPVKLRLKMETAGVTIENPPTLNTTPIYLDGGSTTLLFGQDLIDNFNIDKLIFKGYSKKAYRNSGQLPEGFYRFTIEVLHFHTNKVISNHGTVSAWIAVGQPPELRSPQNEGQLGQYIGMPINFSWLSSKVGSPLAAGNIQYKLEMWEIRNPGISPYTIAASMPVFHEHTTNNTFYSFDPASLMMEPGMTYAWRVTASDISGMVPFEQDGKSEVRTFTYKALCEPVTDIEASSSGKKGTFSWTPGNLHTSYNVEIKNQSTGWFSANETFNSKVEFYDLAPEQTYEIRVQSVCNSDPSSTSDFSQWEPLTIPKEKPMINKEECPDCACDDDIPNITLKNFDLRQTLTPGDTLSNKTGTTRFILQSVEPQGDGTFNGIFYFWAEIWSLKVPCEFWNLQVNTDNVIVNMDYESVYDPSLFLDVDSIIDLANTFLVNAAVLTSDASIKDTIVIDQEYESVFVNAQGELIGVNVDENGNVTEQPLGVSVDETDKTLVQNKDGEEVVVTRNGEVMSVEEYKSTGGGNKRMIRNHKKEKEENNLASSGMVEFSPYTNQNFGFDAYSNLKTSIQNDYPALKTRYRPGFKSVISYGSDKVTVSNIDGLTFKDEMGIPAPVSNNQVTIRGSAPGMSKALYAHRQNNDKEEIAGKLNILSYDEQPKRVCIVPVNSAQLPDEITLQNTLNRIYKQAVTSWTVIKKPAISVTFPSGTMTHGGSGLGTYNADQRAIVNQYVEDSQQLEKDAYYLFFVKNVQDKGKAIAGYMPLKRQMGFIYGKPNNITIAHELAHGAFNLRHPFSDHKFIAPEGTTHNLMDYDTPKGEELWKHQWDLIHDPERVLFAWSQGEEEGAMYGGNCEFTEWIEKIRHASHTNSKLGLTNRLVEGVTKIKLSDNSFVSDIRIYSPNGYNKPLNIDPRIEDMDRTGETMTFIQFGDQVSLFKNYPVYELEIITKPSDKEKVKKYLFDKENWASKVRQHFIDKMIEGREAAVDFMNCLPDEYYADLSLFQRMDILHTLNKATNIKERWFGGTDEEGVITQVIKTTPQNQISELFSKLEEDNLIIDLYKKIHDVFGEDNQTKFMSELLLLYYSQSQSYLSSCAKSTAFYVPWVRETIHYYEYKIGNYTEDNYGYLNNPLNAPNERDIVISADYYYLAGMWNSEKNIIRPMVVSPFTCLSVYFYTPVEFIGIEDMALPMPAIFFKWMTEEVIERQLEGATELTLKIASMAVPGSQLIRGTKSVAGTIISITSLIHATGNLFIEISDASCQNLSTSQSAERFCSLWRNLGLATSSTSNINNIVGEKLPLFYILCFAWDNMLNDPDLSIEQTLGEQEYAKISNTIIQIKQALYE
jgi:hypothetical protein